MKIYLLFRYMMAEITQDNDRIYYKIGKTINHRTARLFLYFARSNTHLNEIYEECIYKIKPNNKNPYIYINSRKNWRIGVTRKKCFPREIIHHYSSCLFYFILSFRLYYYHQRAI